MMEGSHILASLSDVENGIHDLYATVIRSQEDHTQKLCVAKSDGSEVWVTGDQLAALLSQAGAPATPISVSSSPSNPRDASPQNPSLDLTNSGNPDNANPSPNADASSTPLVVEEATSTSSSNSAPTTSLPILDSAPPLVPDYNASTTLSSGAEVASSTAQ